MYFRDVFSLTYPKLPLPALKQQYKGVWWMHMSWKSSFPFIFSFSLCYQYKYMDKTASLSIFCFSNTCWHILSYRIKWKHPLHGCFRGMTWRRFLVTCLCTRMLTSWPWSGHPISSWTALLETWTMNAGAKPSGCKRIVIMAIVSAYKALSY